ncbi:MAG: 30S ribosomal protein S9 [Patescibacteria group bacterium]
MTTAHTKKKDRYQEGIGRRKNAIARVRITESAKPSFKVNDRDLTEYFPVAEFQRVAEEALVKANMRKSSTVTAHVKGGGISAQAEAIRLGATRAIIALLPDLRSEMKQAGFLKRDPRKVERKKFGLRKARRAPQWSKR